MATLIRFYMLYTRAVKLLFSQLLISILNLKSTTIHQTTVSPDRPAKMPTVNDTAVTICECTDGIAVIDGQECVSVDGTLDEVISKYSGRQLSFIKFKDMTVSMALFYAKNPMGQEVIEMTEEKEVSKAVEYSYPQLVAFQVAEFLRVLRAKGHLDNPGATGDWKTDFTSVLCEIARISITGAIFENE